MFTATDIDTKYHLGYRSLATCLDSLATVLAEIYRSTLITGEFAAANRQPLSYTAGTCGLFRFSASGTNFGLWVHRLNRRSQSLLFPAIARLETKAKPAKIYSCHNGAITISIFPPEMLTARFSVDSRKSLWQSLSRTTPTNCTNFQSVVIE